MIARSSKRISIFGILCSILLALIMIIYGFPIYWMITMSLKTNPDIFALPPKWVFNPIIANYKEIFLGGKQFATFYINSLIIGFSALGISLVLGVPAAYALARLNLPRRKDLSFLILTMRMAPPIGIIIPLFIMMRNFNLIDTHIGLALIYSTFNLSYVVWMMRSFFQEIPKEIEEAAMIDGCSKFGTFLRIVLPLATPGLTATAIMCLIFSWNEFFFALIMTGKNAKTAPVAITGFLTHYGIEWGNITAASISIAIPVIIFALLAQRRLVRGLTLGAIK